MSRGFGSDNHAGVLPEVLAALAAANEGHAESYGHDALTDRVVERFRAELGADVEVLGVFNGTGANVLALRALLRPWEGVVCAETAHLEVDETGAPEAWGIKLLTVPTPDGKLTPELVDTRLVRLEEEHVVLPRVVSISQTTEMGTVYSPEEVRALAEHAHANDLLLHMDGARITNAAAALGVSLREATFDLGIDALCFGGTKAGLLFGEAVVLRGGLPSAGLLRLRKQSLQLSSKMRFLSAQLEALLEDERWRAAAGHANAMARRLADAVRAVPGVEVTQEPQANAVFAVLPPGVAARLRERWFFYDWDERRGEVRWMCAWDTTEADVDEFAADLRGAAGA